MSNNTRMAGHAYQHGRVASTPTVVAAVTLLLLVTAAHARWHDERYHGYEVHEATHHHDYSHYPPLGKGYQRIKYHLARASGSGELHEQFPPLYHGEVSLPPGYPRSVRQKRKAPPQQSITPETVPQVGDVTQPPIKRLGLHGDPPVRSQTRPRSEIQDPANKQNSPVAGPRPRNQRVSDVHGTAEDREVRTLLSTDDSRKDDVEDVAESKKPDTTVEETDEIDRKATEAETPQQKLKKIDSAVKSNAPSNEDTSDPGSEYGPTQSMGDGTHTSVTTNVTPVTPTSALGTETSAAPHNEGATNGPTAAPTEWVGSHDLNFQSGVRPLREDWLSHPKKGVDPNIYHKDANKKTPTKRKFKRKTSFITHDDSDAFFTRDGQETNSDGNRRQGVGVARTTNAHAGHHARHGYGNISDILGEFFRQSLDQASAEDTNRHEDRFSDESDNPTTKELDNDTPSLSQIKNNFTRHQPEEYKNEAERGDFNTASKNRHRAHHHHQLVGFTTSREAPAHGTLDFQLERKRPSHLLQEDKPRHDGGGHTKKRGSTLFSDTLFSDQRTLYTSSPHAVHDASSTDARDGNEVHTPRNRRDPNKDRVYGTQDHDDLRGDVVYGTPVHEARRHGHSKVHRPEKDFGPDPAGTERYSLITRTVPGDDAPLPRPDSVDARQESSTPVWDYSPTSHEPLSNGVNYSNGIALNDVRGKTNGKFASKISADHSQSFYSRESNQKFQIKEFSDPFERDRVTATNVNHSQDYFHRFWKPSLKNKNDNRFAVLAPVLKLDVPHHPSEAPKLNYASSDVSQQLKTLLTSTDSTSNSPLDLTTHLESGKQSLFASDFTGTATSHTNQYAYPAGSLPSLLGGKNLYLRQEKRGGGGIGGEGGGGGGGEGGKIHLLLVPEGDYKIYMPLHTSGGVASGGQVATAGGGKKPGPTIINLTGGLHSRKQGGASSGQLNQLQLIQKLLHW